MQKIYPIFLQQTFYQKVSQQQHYLNLRVEGHTGFNFGLAKFVGWIDSYWEQQASKAHKNAYAIGRDRI